MRSARSGTSLFRTDELSRPQMLNLSSLRKMVRQLMLMTLWISGNVGHPWLLNLCFK